MFQSVPLIITFLYAVAGTVTVTDPSGRNTVNFDGNLTLTCTISQLEYYVVWDTPDSSYDLLCFCKHTEDSCFQGAYPDNRANCTSDISKGLFTLTVTNVRISDEGRYRCRHTFNKSTEQGALNISVQVPITSVEMINPIATNITVIENVSSAFVCETSMGRPQASIQWYKLVHNNTEVVILGGIISIVPSEPGVITRSILQYTPSRSDHEYRIYCTAYNIDSSDTVVSTTHPQLYVQFSPRNPVIRYGTRDGPNIISNMTVVRGDTFSIYCTFSSDPSSFYQWSGQTTYSNILTVSEVQRDSTRTCTATNAMKSSEGVKRTGSSSDNVFISVAYGPSIPSFTYHTTTKSHVSVESSLNVEKGLSLNVTCDGSDSNPDALYVWTSQNGQAISETGILIIESVNKDQTSFICIVQNLMKRTFGRKETGRNSATLTINILYSPTINPFTDEILRETQPLSKTCVATQGNPQHTNFRWTRSQDDKVFDGQILFISEIDRHDAGVYTCIAWNVMSPTGEPEAKGESNESFTLKVSYKAEITSFKIFGTTGDGPHIYEESSTFTFHCVVDSYPTSHITISKDGQSIESDDRVTELGYTVNKGTCTDSGLYTCFSYNEFNDDVRPENEIEVIVRCKPRSIDTENNVTLFHDLQEDVILSLEVIAYPSPTQFEWSNRNNDSIWTTLTAGIVTSEFESTLTIRDLQETDYGQYRLIVVNPVGSLVHYFYISKPVIGSAATTGNPGVYIGVGVTGVIVAVAVIVILIVVIKKRQTSTHGRSSKDVSDGGKQRDRKNSPADSGQMQEYINMDLISEGHSSAQRNEYEDLTTRPRDTNVYDELRGETGNTDGATEDKG